MVEITAAAAEQIKVGLANLDDGDLMLRLAVRRLDSGELDYAIGFDEPREQDERLATASGITLLVSPPSLPAAAGTVIDFVEFEPGDMRFIFYRSGEASDELPPAADSTGEGGG
jgi:iron-sulfur cluster assembly protein